MDDEIFLSRTTHNAFTDLDEMAYIDLSLYANEVQSQMVEEIKKRKEGKQKTQVTSQSDVTFENFYGSAGF